MPHAVHPLVAPPSVRDQVLAAIREAVASSDLRRVVVARSDGLAIAHNLNDEASAKHLAAMGAAIVGVSSLASAEVVENGRFKEAFIDADIARIACLQAGEQALVIGIFPQTSNVGLVLLVLRRLADQVVATVAAVENG